MAELLDRWLERRQSVRPISPTTVATYRGYIDRSIRPTLGKLQLGRLDAATPPGVDWRSRGRLIVAHPPSTQAATTTAGSDP